MDVPEISSGATAAIRSRKIESISSYLLLLALQSASALGVLACIHRSFRVLIVEIGVLHSIQFGELVFFVVAIIVSQAGFWLRLKRVAIPGWRSLVLGHILGFSGRISFIFGGALFTVFFLRHAPELSWSQDGLSLVWRAAIVLVALFALYCYALELERLGNALQAGPVEKPPASEPS
jgi:hypothetical protein